MEYYLPMGRDEWAKIGVKGDGFSLMTPLGLAEAELLEYIDKYGSVSLTKLVEDVSLPAPVVMMGVGALIREGLIKASKHAQNIELEISSL